MTGLKRRLLRGLAFALCCCAVAASEAGDSGEKEGKDDASRIYQPGGMWMPQQVAETHSDTLKKMGVAIDPKVFANPLEFPLNAIVHLGGCSASFVSPDGLVVTNHHCVRGYLQYNSTKEQNLWEEGYLAQTREEELSGGPTARVYVTTAVTDVTDQMLDGITDIEDPLDRYKELDRREKAIIREAEAATPHSRCQVAQYYGGGKYFLITKLEIKDVRLVYAPHEGIGYFGGDIDNWMWPRHCGDFALLRAYVAPDGQPAEYSPDNVPYKPKAWLDMAQEGPAEGDLVFVVGYPAHTARLRTAKEIIATIEEQYPVMIETAQAHIDRLHEICDGDADLTIKAASSLFGLENGKKKRMGILEGAERKDMVDLKRAEDKALTEWIQADAKRKAEFGSALSAIDALVDKYNKDWLKNNALSGFASRGSSLLSAAHTLVRMAEERPKPDAEREPGYQERDWQRLEQGQERMQKNYARVIDEGCLELYIQLAVALPPASRPEIVNDLFGDGVITIKTIRKQIKDWFDHTELDDLDKRLELLRSATLEDLEKSEDTLIQLALKFKPTLRAREEKSKRYSGEMILARPVYYRALSAMKDGALAPDANGTIRLSFGTVRGYRPTPEAPVYYPFTNVWQMVEKWARNKDAFPFKTTPKIIDAVVNKRFGPYAVDELGGVPVDFLADLDITGGNSGSPTLNARGEFCGIAFDGNIEGVASDLVFMEDTTRSIHTDVRYFLWVLDAVEGAEHLLKELRVEPVFAGKKQSN